jgi:protocatechuate 3,4-dioxygenase beta subunit
MLLSHLPVARRRFLQSLSFSAVGLAAPGAFAAELTRTPHQTEGPFYPDRLPLDTDNDLLILNDSMSAAVGEITHLTGKVTTTSGAPVRNAVVEIWQVDHNGSYIHTGSGGRSKLDKNFQGFGRFLTGSKGEYYFRTIKPVPYPGRTPHIHVAINQGGKRILTTQLYIAGDPRNQRDGIVGRMPAALAKTLLVDFTPVKNSRIKELNANFDIVIGNTPEDPDFFRKRRGG